MEAAITKNDDYLAVATHEAEEEGLVVLRDSDEDETSFVTAAQSTTAPARRGPQAWYRRTLLPDDVISCYNIRFVEGIFSIKLAKFTIFTYLGILAWYKFVRYFDSWEHKDSLQLQDLFMYEANLIFTDIVVFFVVGRLYNRIGVDTLEFTFMVVLANVYSSFITEFSIFEHSFTLYEMHCRWPWQLWVFVVLLVPLIVTIALLHVRYAWRNGVLVQKCVEMVFTSLFLLVPLLPSEYFHLHHWFAGFLIGMHLNFDAPWSRLTMAWCWGSYINGIAVYGRDPVLTCGYAYFLSETQRCPFVACYLEALANPDHSYNNHTVEEMKTPDWRNCSADAYHP